MGLALGIAGLLIAYGTIGSAPIAGAGTDQNVACEVAGGAEVVLDGSSSKDPDSTPGTNDDIVAFEWSEGGVPIGSGESVALPFPVGVHEIALTVTDAEGNSDEDEVVIVVADTATPGIACPENVTVECEATNGSNVLVPLASSKDTCFGTAPITNSRTQGGENASGSYPLGATTVTFTATDAAGNAASCDAVVTVVDTVAPVLVLEASPRILWPPNHAMRAVHVGVAVVDVCDPSPRIVLRSVVSSEPDDAPGGGDGTTTGDVQQASCGTADVDLLLRAERQGSGPCRTYTLAYQATDGSGNASTGTTSVSVPH
jgi:hypothetical protein